MDIERILKAIERIDLDRDKVKRDAEGRVIMRVTPPPCDSDYQ